METHVTGHYVLGELRRHALIPLPGHPLFTEAEQQRAIQFAQECEDIACLTRWTMSVRIEITRRETAAARQRRQRATHEMLRHLRDLRFRGDCPRPLHLLPAWVPGVPLSAQADRRAGTFDHLAATCFQTASALTLDDLLNRQSR